MLPMVDSVEILELRGSTTIDSQNMCGVARIGFKLHLFLFIESEFQSPYPNRKPQFIRLCPPPSTDQNNFATMRITIYVGARGLTLVPRSLGNIILKYFFN